MRPTPFWLVPLFLLLGAMDSSGHYALPETEKVPIARLFTNLQARLTRNPKDYELTYQLARLHSMAYATNLIEVTTLKKEGYPHWWETKFTGLPRQIQAFKTPEARRIALRHLTNAIALYQHSLLLLKQATNAYSWQVVQPQLGLAWCLDQTGQRTAALDAYRKALKTAWKMEVTGDFDFKEWLKDAWTDVKAGQNPIHSRNLGFILSGECYCEEIIGYMLNLLDPVKDTREIADLKARQSTLSKMGRAITPILVPLEADTQFNELVNPTAAVRFDLDGSGLPRRWGWITPKAAWLVYDSDGSGQITSGLQMFGRVTFWIFWHDGYAALSALDDNGDGELSGAELRGLALWQDRNGNGLCEPGEVRSVQSFGIVAIPCQGQMDSTNLLWHPRGVRFSDGSTRPTYDWIVPGQAP